MVRPQLLPHGHPRPAAQRPRSVLGFEGSWFRCLTPRSGHRPPQEPCREIENTASGQAWSLLSTSWTPQVDLTAWPQAARASVDSSGYDKARHQAGLGNARGHERAPGHCMNDVKQHVIRGGVHAKERGLTDRRASEGCVSGASTHSRGAHGGGAESLGSPWQWHLWARLGNGI